MKVGEKIIGRDITRVCDFTKFTTDFPVIRNFPGWKIVYACLSVS